ncbi:MAG: 8-amino-7-oxononanoate synthase [Gammaproteobacteria bacterium]|nr:8-amino-7-oxononanoate synthase [Gammaproteobacteria bacterium]
MHDDLKAELEQRRQQGLYRQRLITQSAQGVHPRINGREVLSFCSNDYLGLANHPALKQAMIDAIQTYGVGSGSAHLVNGHSQLHHDCEQRLAEFTGRDRALLFSTGYMANLAITSALVGRNDFILQDKLNHASLIDAARVVDAKFLRFRHLDLDQLQQQLAASNEQKPAARRLVMTDAVFSMDGDKADIQGLAQLCREYGGWLMIDDAHGFGVLGEHGAGLCEEQGLDQQQVPILMATLGKAVGVSGAFVAGSEELIETLVQQARSYIYTTASPPSLAAAVLRSIEIIEDEAWRREKLQQLIAYFRQQMLALECQLLPSDTAIQPIVIGDNQQTLDISRQLLEQGIHVTAIRPPTVAPGSARLRITLSAAHETTDIDRLVKALAGLFRQD